jgi:hypothetical protein
MSDFSREALARCPFCGGVFSTSDGCCDCPGSLAHQEQMDEQQFVGDGVPCDSYPAGDVI